MKRAAILHGLGAGPLGRVLELASGNGSNSRAIAPRARRLDATEGTIEGTRLTAQAIAAWPRARAIPLVLPGGFPRPTYDAVVIAELLYYLSPHAMRQVAAQVAASLRPGGRLILAHHRVDYYDFVQHAAAIQARFLRLTGWRGSCIPSAAAPAGTFWSRGAAAVASDVGRQGIRRSARNRSNSAKNASSVG
ncbi:class I SAM-dependent methyltransferase [Sphingomonas sp. I4]